MAELKIKGMDNLVELLARLRQIPVAKVIRNAAKDFVQAGFMDTPKAARMAGKNPWAILPGRGRKAGKAVRVNLDKYRAEVEARPRRNFSRPRPKSRHLSRLEAYRLARPRRGFAVSLWIPVMQSLGFKKKAPPGAAPFDQVRNGFNLFAKTSGGYSDGFRERVEAYRKGRQSDHTLATATEGGSQTRPTLSLSVHEPSLDRYPQWEATTRQKGLALAGARLIRALQKAISSKDPSKVPDSTL